MTTNEVRHPEVHVQLTGRDGNAFAVLGNIRRELRRAGVGQAEMDEFMAEATAGDYDDLLTTCLRWVDAS